MATILEFRAQSSKSSTVAGRLVVGAGAEIVFFPGVRYERWSEELPVRPKGKKIGRRDTLDLED